MKTTKTVKKMLSLAYSGAYKSITTTLDYGNGVQLDPGESYIAYAMVLPLGDEYVTALKGKNLEVVVATTQGEFVAYVLSSDYIAETNPNGEYNWNGNKSYTFQVGTRCYDGCSYDLNGVAFEEADLSLIKHAIENPGKLSTAEKYACDINGDGNVSEEDLTELEKLYDVVDSEEHIITGKKCKNCGINKLEIADILKQFISTIMVTS